MKKYIIKLEDGKFVEKFYKSSVCVTSVIKRGGKYSRSIANKRLDNLKLNGELLESD